MTSKGMLTDSTERAEQWSMKQAVVRTEPAANGQTLDRPMGLASDSGSCGGCGSCDSGSSSFAPTVVAEERTTNSEQSEGSKDQIVPDQS